MGHGPSATRIEQPPRLLNGKGGRSAGMCRGSRLGVHTTRAVHRKTSHAHSRFSRPSPSFCRTHTRQREGEGRSVVAGFLLCGWSPSVSAREAGKTAKTDQGLFPCAQATTSIMGSFDSCCLVRPWLLAPFPPACPDTYTPIGLCVCAGTRRHGQRSHIVSRLGFRRPRALSCATHAGSGLSGDAQRG